MKPYWTLHKSKGLKRSTQCGEDLRLLWEEGLALYTREWQLGKSDTGGGR